MLEQQLSDKYYLPYLGDILLFRNSWRPSEQERAERRAAKLELKRAQNEAKFLTGLLYGLETVESTNKFFTKLPDGREINMYLQIASMNMIKPTLDEIFTNGHPADRIVIQITNKNIPLREYYLQWRIGKQSILSEYIENDKNNHSIVYLVDLPGTGFSMSLGSIETKFDPKMQYKAYAQCADLMSLASVVFQTQTSLKQAVALLP
jgi:hypothetical protein